MGLREAARHVTTRDWLFLVVDTPVSDAAVSILEEALEELGLPLPSWDTGGDYVIIFGQTRAPGLPVATVTAADGDAVFRLRPTGEPR